MHFTSISKFTCMLIAFGLLGQALPTEFARRAPSMQCNDDRAQITSALSDVQCTVQMLTTEASNDIAVSAAAQTALGGLNITNGGVDAILQAVQAGQAPPADARVQVEQGLTVIQAALNSTASTDAGITSTLAKAQSQLLVAISAGNAVLVDCN